MDKKNRAGELPPVSTESTSISDGDHSLHKLLPFAWPVFTVLWLVFPIGSVVEMLREDLAPIRLLGFLTSMAAFVAVFLWLMLAYPFHTGELSSSVRRTRIGLLVVLATLALFLELGYGSGIPYHFMFVVLTAAVTLPTLWAAGTVMAVTVVESGLYALRAGWAALLSTWESAVAPFLIVGLSMIIVSRLVVTVRELRAAREEIARLAVAEERLRFARDLHDLLGHSLSLITLKSTLAGRLLPITPETKRAANEVRDIEEVARGALREVREAVAGYRQPTLEDELAGAHEMLDAAGIACHVERTVNDMPLQTDAVLAWAVREGATNVIRHSRARHCEIRVHQTGGEVCVEISDDGIGTPTPDKANGTGSGSGLSGLTERVVASGGDIEAGLLTGEGSSPRGFRLRVSLPLSDGLAALTDEPSIAPNGARADDTIADGTIGEADNETTEEAR